MVVLLKLKQWLVWSNLNKPDSYSGITETEQTVAYHKLLSPVCILTCAGGKGKTSSHYVLPHFALLQDKAKPTNTIHIEEEYYLLVALGPLSSSCS